MEAPGAEAELASLKEKVAQLEREIAQMKAAGFVTQRDLARLVPAIVADHQRRRG